MSKKYHLNWRRCVAVNISKKKTCMVKSKRNFCKMKKVRVEICNIHIYFQRA